MTIAAGTSVDVIEMDAASNRSVDDIRDLRERVAYAPAAGRWKVYILDEAHMLTKEAWNAFLKTLEEPPPNTVFVLATTEAHKVMPTIADRCQRFDFQRPSLEQISEVLGRVAEAEGFELEGGAITMIARSASGSFRDALSTLDQLVAFGGNRVGLEQVLELLGATDADLLFEAVDAVAAEDPKGVLLSVERMAGSGRDPAQFARDLLTHLRHLLVTQTVGEVPETFVVTATDTDRLTAQAGAIGAANLLRTIDELASALTAVREGDDARMAVEIALLKAARPDLDPSTEGLLRRIEKLEQERRSSAGARVIKVEAEPAADEAELAAEPGAEPLSEGIEPVDLERIIRLWPAVLDQLRQSSAPALAALFEGARPVDVDREDSTLTVGFSPSATFNKRKAEAPDKRDLVAAALEAVAGERLRPVYVVVDGEVGAEGTAGEAELDEEELVERLKSEFDAEEVG